MGYICGLPVGHTLEGTLCDSSGKLKEEAKVDIAICDNHKVEEGGAVRS